jgi:superfamily II DNA or RNA helicase
MEAVSSRDVMTVIKVEKLNEVHLRVYSEDMGVESELCDFFTYEYPGAKFTPKFKARLWDGKIRLYDQIRKTIYVGLLDYIYKFAETRGYQVDADGISTAQDINEDQVLEFATSLDLHGRGEPIEIRDYQVEAVHTALSSNRAVLLSPTGSGKSLIIYTMCRWHIEEGRKIIVVVPTTSLVEQMYSDFEDYSSANGWSVKEHCQKLYSGFPKHFEKDILFTTWQSAYTMPKAWFQQFNVIIGDEAHQFKAKSLTTIMERMPNVAYRVGTTGSLDDKKVNRLVLQGIFGPIHRVTTTKKLQDEGKLADLKITALLLKYPEEVRKSCNKMDYQAEIDFLVKNESRNKFIRNLTLKCTGNTLLLFQFVDKHGSVLYDMIKEKAGDRPVYFIHGGTDVDDREHIRKILSTQTNAIVVASFGTTSTGINIPSIENIIFASPSKSIIRNLQSIGRGLRLNKGKTHCNLYDLTDDLHWKSWKNHTLKHGAERYKLYASEQFKINLVEVEL